MENLNKLIEEITILKEKAKLLDFILKQFESNNGEIAKKWFSGNSRIHQSKIEEFHKHNGKTPMHFINQTKEKIQMMEYHLKNDE
jgi:hypothetical protein